MAPFACADAGDPPSPQPRLPRTLLLTAAPQDAEVFLTWSPTEDAGYAVRWRAAGDSRWHSLDAGSIARRAVPALQNGTSYRFRVDALREGAAVATSNVVTVVPRPRPDCATPEYIPGVSFFCTKSALDAYLQQHGIDPLSLRCRQRPVLAWTADAPDCLYATPRGEHLLLLRSADDTFLVPGDAPMSAPIVREHARRAIWGVDHPFESSAAGTLPLQPIVSPVVGNVSKHASARSFEIPLSSGLRSMVTWFAPAEPIAGRYSIYHEGHGGAAVEIGAETIDWLLEAGWQVVAMDMPLIGANKASALRGLEEHNDFDALDDGVVSPLQHFLLPVKAVVDAIAQHAGNQERDLLMIGRSGGGWTTYVYGAIDARIGIAVSVAGGRPISARLDAPWGAAELGDYEQTAPHLYNVTGHEHLMRAAGSKGAFYVFNKWDACCYRVEQYDPFVRYLRRGSGAGGKPIGVFVDTEHPGHSMGPRAYVALERFLRSLLRS